jgi:hypothetical protein
MNCSYQKNNTKNGKVNHPNWNTSRLPTSGWVVPINNNGGVPFKSGGNESLGGNGGGLPRVVVVAL